ncbi:MAG: hypothetical protein WCK89_20820, partial [bacterium]
MRLNSLSTFLTVAALLPAPLAALAANSARAAGAAPRPNIVFLLIDDLGRTDVGFMGCKDVCSPTRAALMTGRYATHTGVYTIVRPHAKW